MKGAILTISTFLAFFGWLSGNDLNSQANKLIRNFSDEQKRTKNLIMEGSGGAWPDGELKLISLIFIKAGSYSIPEVRRLMVSTMNELLSKVNNDEKLHKHLKKGEFTTSMIDMSVSFRTLDGGRVQPPGVALTFFQNGKIYYMYWDKDTDKLYGDDRETYEEAVQKLREDSTR